MESNDVLFLRTPISGSMGFVSLVEDGDESFYGCGETGAIWRKKENLFRDIENIITEYTHRKECYLKQEGEWIANPNEPQNIEELIEGENYYELVDFEQD